MTESGPVMTVTCPVCHAGIPMGYAMVPVEAWEPVDSDDSIVFLGDLRFRVEATDRTDLFAHLCTHEAIGAP